jgi:uncharacterized protein YndB with AHSA1/START domain
MSNRTIELETEVPGTPEEVWDAIATGHGITTWFVPAQVEERVGGTMALDFGPGYGSQPGTVKAWEPSRRVVFEMNGLAGHPLAYEWSIEARGGGTCVVRLVNSGFLDEAEWQAEYNSTYGGWKLFMYNLRLARTHFPGQRCASMIVNGTTQQPSADAWRTLTSSLGLPLEPRVGDHVSASATDGPTLAGGVDRFEERLLTLLVDSPARGIAFVGLEGSGDTLFVLVYAYLYGPEAAAVLARDEPGWRAWMQRTFAGSATPA